MRRPGDAAWHTPHAPAVLAYDEGHGALLLDAVDPGTPLALAPDPPASERVAALMAALQGGGVAGFPPVEDRIGHLFRASRVLYERHPDSAAVVPPELYERGRRLATHLAADPASAVLLHGDLTPGNVLDGGTRRGLVTIDPAPCVGDPAFDGVDLLLWRAYDVATVTARADRFAAAGGPDATRLVAWCVAFAGMVALEVAGEPGADRRRLDTLLALAYRA
ncbi:MAG TPA: aminoglycoside phosphotransferase family protein [Actinocatenispora sp.]